MLSMQWNLSTTMPATGMWATDCTEACCPPRGDEDCRGRPIGTRIALLSGETRIAVVEIRERRGHDVLLVPLAD